MSGRFHGKVHRFLITSGKTAIYMIDVVVGANGISTGMDILIEILVFCHPLESGELIDMPEFFYFMVNRIGSIIPVYINIYGFGWVKLGGKQIIIKGAPGNCTKEECSD